MKRACLLTGEPGVGKTTLIKQAVETAQARAGGFYTEEIRVSGARRGFKIVTLDGESAILAHADFESPHRVSKYGVDVEGLERVGVAALRDAIRDCDLVVIDEIGKMELCSPAFREAATQALDSGKLVLGTIMAARHPVADDIKRHPDVTVVAVTRANRQRVLEGLADWLRAATGGSAAAKRDDVQDE